MTQEVSVCWNQVYTWNVLSCYSLCFVHGLWGGLCKCLFVHLNNHNQICKSCLQCSVGNSGACQSTLKSINHFINWKDADKYLNTLDSPWKVLISKQAEPTGPSAEIKQQIYCYLYPLEDSIGTVNPRATDNLGILDTWVRGTSYYRLTFVFYWNQ